MISSSKDVTFSAWTRLKMDQSSFLIRLICGQSLKNHSVGTFAVELDLAIRPPDNCGHPLPGRVKFANVEDFELIVGASNVDEHGFGFPRLSISDGQRHGVRTKMQRTYVELESQELGTCYKGGFVGTASLIDDLFVLDFGDDGVADCE